VTRPIPPHPDLSDRELRIVPNTDRRALAGLERPLRERDWTIPIGDGVFDPVHRILASARGRVRLSPLESDVLFYLTRHGGDPRPIHDLAAEVWGCSDAAETTACRQVMRTLRRKLREFDAKVALLNVSRAGYCLMAVGRALSDASSA